MARYVVGTVVVAALTFTVARVERVNGDTTPTTTRSGAASPSTPTRTVTVPSRAVVRELERARARLRREHRRALVEHARYLSVRHRAHALTRTLKHDPSVREAITLACIVFGSCDTLWRRARCETGGTFSPRSWNPTDVGNGEHASGLFQFLPSTWRSTPFAALSIWSAYANALAAGWMEAHGRGGEWDCR